MGGRVLKYDSGEVAISVSGFGGVTLYVSSVPQGLPAERTGVSMPPSLPPVSLQDVQGAAADEAQHLSYTRRLNVSFTANWGMLANDPPARAFALDTIGNTARGIDQFAASAAGHDALARRVNLVSFEEGGRPTITLNGRTLIVTFNPGRGLSAARHRARLRTVWVAFCSLFICECSKPARGNQSRRRGEPRQTSRSASYCDVR